MLASCSVGYYSTDTVVIKTANISLQPAWGPAGYDCAHYYYFPDYNFYYDVNHAVFYYLSGSRWVSVKQLPYSLGYPRDLYPLYKVVLNIHEPWKYNRHHKKDYKHFCGMKNQPVLRNNRPQSRPPQGPQQVKPRPQSPHQPRPNNGYNDNRQPQAKPPQNNGNMQRPGNSTGQKPQNNGTALKPNNGNMQKPQGGGSGADYRETVRNSRNNNTSNNNIAPQQGSSSRNNSAQPSQGSKPKQSVQSPSGSRNSGGSVSGSRSNAKPSQATQTKSSGSRNNSKPGQATQSKSSSSTRSTKDSKSNSSSGSRSTGSRGR